VAHHPSGMVVLCRACGHVHLALRMLGDPPEQRAEDDGPAAVPAVDAEAAGAVGEPAATAPDSAETVRALGQVVRRPRPTLLRSVQ
jgi:hypothetical protein